MAGVAGQVDLAAISSAFVAVVKAGVALADGAVAVLQAGVPLFGVEQILPQVPQLRRSLLELTSQPSIGPGLQVSCGALQAAVMQVPAAQMAFRFGVLGQTLPQLPQLLRSAEPLVSAQPLTASPSQSR